jgi:hypothetical protein
MMMNTGVVAEQLAGLIFDETAHLYYLDGVWVPGVTMVLEGVGLIDYTHLGAKREIYLDRGRAVHTATHYDDQGDLGTGLSDEILGYLMGWRKFRRDFGFVPNRIEQLVCNRRYGYAGRLDRTGTVRDGSEIIVDIKSGIAPPAVRYQMAAYAACLLHPRTRLRRCVELHRDATYRVIPFATRDYQHDFDTFVQAVGDYKAIEKNKGEKRWKTAAIPWPR